MKKLTTRIYTPALVLCAGIAGAAARAAFYALFWEETGLLPRNHPLEIFCILLTAAVALWTALVVKDVPGNNSFFSNLSGNKATVPLSVPAAAGILLSALTDLDPANPLQLARTVLGILSAGTVVYAAVLRVKGKRPRFYLYGALCLFYALHMLCCYRHWSGDPQLPDYAWQLLASAAMTLTAYQRTALCVGLGRRRIYLFTSLMAGFLGILCSPGSGTLLYLTSAALFLGDLSLFPGQEPSGPENMENA